LMKLNTVLAMFKALSEKSRLQIFLLLIESELCVCELMDRLRLEQSLVSHQLRILRRAGLVESQKRGRWVYYRISEDYRQKLGSLLKSWLGNELRINRKVLKIAARRSAWQFSSGKEKNNQNRPKIRRSFQPGEKRIKKKL